MVTKPFFSGDFASHEVYQKTSDLVSALGDQGVPVVAPYEYVHHNRQLDVIRGSDLAIRLRDQGVAFDNAIALDFRVVSLGGSRQVAVAGAGEELRGGSLQYPGEVRVTLRSLWDGKKYAEVVIAYEEDPLGDEVTEFNRYPALSRAVKKAAGQLAEMWREQFAHGEDALGGARFSVNPTYLFDFEHNELPTVNERLREVDSLEAVARRLQYYQYFEPDISIERMLEFQSRPPGLLVEEPGALSSYGIKPGDYITHVAGAEAVGAHVLVRQLVCLRGQSIDLQLDRNGATEEVEIPATAVLALVEPAPRP